MFCFSRRAQEEEEEDEQEKDSPTNGCCRRPKRKGCIQRDHYRWAWDVSVLRCVLYVAEAV